MKKMELTRAIGRLVEQDNPQEAFQIAIREKLFDDAQIILDEYLNKISADERFNTFAQTMRKSILSGNIRGIKYLLDIKSFDINSIIESTSNETSLLYSAGGYNDDPAIYKDFLSHPQVNLFAENISGVSFLGKAIILKNYGAYTALCSCVTAEKLEQLKAQVLNSSNMNVYNASSWSEIMEKSFNQDTFRNSELACTSDMIPPEQLRNLDLMGEDFDNLVVTYQLNL